MAAEPRADENVYGNGALADIPRWASEFAASYTWHSLQRSYDRMSKPSFFLNMAHRLSDYTRNRVQYDRALTRREYRLAVTSRQGFAGQTTKDVMIDIRVVVALVNATKFLRVVRVDKSAGIHVRKVRRTNMFGVPLCESRGVYVR